MKLIGINDKGFSLTELLFAMSILSVGLLAMAHMQIMAVRGTAASRDFSTATNLAREGMESIHPPMKFYFKLETRTDLSLSDINTGNNADGDHAPDITHDTDIVADMDYDFVEVLSNTGTKYEADCGPRQNPLNCDTLISAGDWDFVRIFNIRNMPDGVDSAAIMKDVNVIVLWKDGTVTRSVNVRTIIARKDIDFF